MKRTVHILFPRWIKLNIVYPVKSKNPAVPGSKTKASFLIAACLDGRSKNFIFAGFNANLYFDPSILAMDSFSFWKVTSRDSEITLTSPNTGIKLVSPPQRGTTWM
jgi:hypothetical protein